MNLRIVAPLAIALGVLSHAAHGQGADIHDAFFNALHSPSGMYQGELNGEFADFARKMLKSSSSVHVTVTTLRSFSQQGCKRLRADIAMPEAHIVDPTTGARSPFSYRYEMNLCEDGSPPREGAMNSPALPGGRPVPTPKG